MEPEKILKQILSSTPLIKKKGLSLVDIIEAAHALNIEISDKQIKRHINLVVNEKGGYIMKAAKRESKTGRTLYKLRITRINPIGQSKSGDTNDTNMIGKAGEMSVISELLFSGYTANTMIVDKGIDIVASKDNKFYYIQVKTTHLDENGRCSVSIPVAAYERVSTLGNVSFVIVVRLHIGGNIFIVFTQRDVDLAIGNGDIERTEANVNIKIRFDSIDKKPYLYNGRHDKCIFAYQNNFKLA